MILVCLELVTRAWFPRILFLDSSRNLFTYRVYGQSYANTKNTVASSFETKIYLDNHGFRIDPQAENPSKRELPAIILIGDSVFFGPGVPARKTFSELLNRRLDHYRIINTAVVGYNVHDYQNFLDYFILPNQNRLKIHRVILGLCLNDLQTISNINIIEKSAVKPDQMSPMILLNKIKSWDLGLNNFLKSNSKFFLLIKSLLLDSSKIYFQYDSQLYRNDLNVKPVVDVMDYLNTTLHQKDIPFTVVILPYEYQLREQNQYNEYPNTVLRKAFQAKGIDYLDAYDYFAGEMKKSRLHSRELFLFNDPMHLSETGHRLLYQLIAPTLTGHQGSG